ncbi:MAG: hypothetical protein VCE43_12990, partial [Myxococcota bacterium]
MKTEHTLRHLLLRHFKGFEGAVSPERFVEVTQSLRVETQGRTAYVVSYRDGGQVHEQNFPFDSFKFYERGDTRADQRSIDDDLRNRNDERAHDFAEPVFGISLDSLPVRPAEPLDANRRVAMAEMAIVVAAVAWVAGFDLVASVALLVLVLAEFAPHGRLISSALFGIVAITAPATAALLAALAYGMLQFLDPNPDRRNLRVGLCLLAVALAGARFGFGSEVSVWGMPAMGGLILAISISAFRSLYSSHF